MGGWTGFLLAVIKYQFLREDKCLCNWNPWEGGGWRVGTPVGLKDELWEIIAWLFSS